jgi:3-oxoacyl-[acyl-carrier protein] reductase
MHVIVTGASRGIGYHSAMQFAKIDGAVVFALGRNASALDKLRKQGGANIIPLAVDIADEARVKEAIGKISQSTSSIDLLLNNAGLLVNKPFGEISYSDWLTVYGANVFGVANLIRMALPMLRNGNISGGGDTRSHIVNIASMGGIQGSQKFSGLTAYSSSKGALIILTECLADELQSTGIRINAVALGSVETEMFSEAFPGMKAGMKPASVASWINHFAMTGHEFFQGKVIPVSTTTP